MAQVIALVAALPAECRALMGRAPVRAADGWPLQERIYHDGTKVVCVRCGVGMPRARAAAESAIARGADILVSIGIAGGLACELAAGSLIVCGSISETDGFSACRPPRVIWAAAKQVQVFLNRRGLDAHFGMLLSAKDPVLTAGAKQALGASTGALGVDMECAAVASAASRSDIPFFALRAVSDPCDQSIPPELYSCIKANGELSPARVLSCLLKKPALLSRLHAAGSNYRAALLAIKKAWREILQNRQTLLFTNPRT